MEFGVENDESGKIKAVNVTEPGGAPIKPPPRKERKPRNNKKRDTEATGEGENKEESAPSAEEGDEKAKKQNGKRNSNNAPPFHDVIESDVKSEMEKNGLKLGRKTVVDLAMQESRIRLGENGNASIVLAAGVIGEGSFTCDAKGSVTFTWEHVLEYVDDKWVPGGMDKLMKSLSLVSGTCVSSGRKVRRISTHVYRFVFTTNRWSRSC